MDINRIRELENRRQNRFNFTDFLVSQSFPFKANRINIRGTQQGGSSLRVDNNIVDLCLGIA